MNTDFGHNPAAASHPPARSEEERGCRVSQDVKPDTIKQIQLIFSIDQLITLPAATVIVLRPNRI